MMVCLVICWVVAVAALLVWDALLLKRSVLATCASVCCGLCPLLCAIALAVVYVVTESWDMKFKNSAAVGVSALMFLGLSTILLKAEWESYQFDLNWDKQFPRTGEGFHELCRRLSLLRPEDDINPPRGSPSAGGERGADRPSEQKRRPRRFL